MYIEKRIDDLDKKIKQTKSAAKKINGLFKMADDIQSGKGIDISFSFGDSKKKK